MTIRHKPYTDTELDIAADNSAPTVVGDANVQYAPTTGVSSAQNRIGPKKIILKARFSGVGAAAASIVVNYRMWDPWAEVYHSVAEFTLVGESLLSDTLGAVAVLDHDPNISLAHIQVTGLDGDEDAHFVVNRVEQG